MLAARELDDDVDWVIALRLLHHRDPGRTPTEAEIRLTVWFLLDQGYTLTEVGKRTGLPKSDVARIYDLRRLAAGSDPEPGHSTGRRTPAQARALRPHWYYVMILGGAYVQPLTPKRVVKEPPVLVGAAS